jgi:hypothetical protein
VFHVKHFFASAGAPGPRTAAYEAQSRCEKSKDFNEAVTMFGLMPTPAQSPRNRSDPIPSIGSIG